MKYMESSTDPKYSPLTPAQFVQPKEDLSEKQKETKVVDVYDPDIPALDNFSGGIAYDPLIRDDRFSTINVSSTDTKPSRMKKSKAKKDKRAGKPSTPKTMRGGTNEIIPEMSEQESGMVKSS